MSQVTAYATYNTQHGHLAPRYRVLLLHLQPLAPHISDTHEAGECAAQQSCSSDPFATCPHGRVSRAGLHHADLSSFIAMPFHVDVGWMAFNEGDFPPEQGTALWQKPGLGCVAVPTQLPIFVSLMASGLGGSAGAELFTF